MSRYAPRRPMFSDTMPMPAPADLARPACSADACRGGRRPCPCPEACQLQADEHAAATQTPMRRAVAVAVLAVCLACLWAAWSAV